MHDSHPAGTHVACVRGGDLYVLDIAADSERRLTSGATETLTRGLAEFVAQEEMGRMHGYWWSPDSKTIIYQETDTSDIETLHIADPARPERPAQSWRYPRPGKNNARVRLGLVPSTGGKTCWIQWDEQAFPYVAGVMWDEKAPPVVLVQNREQQVELLLAVDPATGATKEILRETDDAWLNLDGSVPRWLPSGNGFLWSTERAGNWQLELRDRAGAITRPLTTTALNYRRVVGIDENAGTALIIAGAEPTQSQVYRLPINEPGKPASAVPLIN